MTYDILITNAKTRASGKETVDIGIRAVRSPTLERTSPPTRPRPSTPMAAW